YGMPGGGRGESSVYATSDEMQAELLKYIQTVVDDVVKYPGTMSIGLSGGSMPKVLGPVLAKLKVDPDRLRLFLVDERLVEYTSPDSNYGAWLAALPEPLHVCLAGVELVDVNYRPDRNTFPYDIGRSALAYEMKLKNHHVGPEIIGRFPKFDMIFLGMGPDGHTASIFPGAKLFRLKLDSYAWFVGVEDSPKPPPQRITMTMQAINAADHVAFICTGEDKAPALKQVFDRDSTIPAAHVHPASGKLRFFLDPPAASRL
ncbi:hypothetical protein PFISCL1PPCAC_26080, partial [Pristionchus fissidentatus]